MVVIEREHYITTRARRVITGKARAKVTCEIYIIPGSKAEPMLLGDDLVTVGEVWFKANCERES